ncbi:MAG: TIGR04282 family arsenosugar biosynthesis glycosyltransferase [Chromatiaceae bacterium]|nr:TIGR04282 family arsenosugar biosynthesis glycosyltransferase [Chromatiaceae bacterium]
MRFPNARILVFAKAPVPGQCKTRLIPALGAEGAAQLAEALLCHTLERVTNARLAPVELWCAPEMTHPLFLQLAERLQLCLQVQRGPDLGARLQAAAASALGRAEQVLLIGTDCPDLDASYLQQALQALTKQRAVLGPAEDGGYVLLGLRREALSALSLLLTKMPWGTAQVAQITRERMRDAGLAWTELASLADIDQPEDLALLER